MVVDPSPRAAENDHTEELVMIIRAYLLVAACLPLTVSVALSVPLIPALLGPEASPAFRSLVVLVLAASITRAWAGLILAFLTLPFCQALALSFDGMPTRPEVADAVVLALAGGTWLRRVWVGDDQPSRLAGPAAILAAAVVTSTIIELQTLQAISPRRPLLTELWLHLSQMYWMEPREFPVVHGAIRWLAWLAAAVSAERVVRSALPQPGMVFRFWLIAGVAGALLTIGRLLEIVLSRGGWGAMSGVFTDVRLSALQPDLNAAGSYFLLFLLPALVSAMRRRVDGLAVAALLPIGLAFLVARSRAALVACLSVAFAVYIVPAERPVSRRRLARRLAVVAVAAAAALAAVHVGTSATNTDPGTALQYRVEMAQVGLTAARRYPVFGVGLGDYIRMTRRLITPDMPLAYSSATLGENAHNNLLQIAVELGIPAAVVFVWLVLPVAATGFRIGGDSPASSWAQGMSLGLAAFLVSALFGHPLLIPQVGATFFLGLGVAAGMGPRLDPVVWRTRLVRVMAGFYIASLLWRL